MDVSRSHPTTSIRGNVFGMTGMGMAIDAAPGLGYVAVVLVVEPWAFILASPSGSPVPKASP